MWKKIILILAVGIFMVDFAGCKKDSAPQVDCTTGWAAAVQANLSDLSAAAIAYSNDPSADNCNAYKQAVQNYIDALGPFGDCVYDAGQQAAFDNALSQAQASIDGLDC